MKAAVVPGMLTKTISLFIVLMLVLPAPVPAQFKTTLRENTLAEFSRYIAAAETTIRQRWELQRSFLWVRERKGAIEQLQKGEIVIDKGALDKKIDIPNGMAHHWIGSVFVPKGNIQKALSLLQDFERHQKIYPEIVASRPIERKGDALRGYWRLRKEKVITVVLDVEQEVQYHQAGENRWYSHGHFTSVREVDDPGTPQERILPPDEGRGFLWRLNAYWRLEAAPEGLYMECESITLSRDIPFGLAFVIGPIVGSLPRESLLGSLRATRAALQ